jgi:hypothetical protein
VEWSGAKIREEKERNNQARKRITKLEMGEELE